MLRVSMLLSLIISICLFVGGASAQQLLISRVSVLNFKPGSGISEGEASILTDRLLVELACTPRFKVIDRERRDELLKETAFGQTGACDDATCLIQAGKYLQAEKMVGGSVGRIGDIYTINLIMVDVETGRIEYATPLDLPGSIDELLTTAMWKVAWQLARSGLSERDQQELIRLQKEDERKRAKEQQELVRRRKEKEQERTRIAEQERRERGGPMRAQRARKLRRNMGWGTLILAGAAGCGAWIEKERANKAYDKYKAATTIDSADYYKKQVENEDKATTVFLGISAVSALTSGILLWSSLGGGETVGSAKDAGVFLGMNKRKQPVIALVMRF